MSRLNLRRLEIFQAVYEQGSVSAAARLLNITQPSVSRMLKDFELDLGFKLFELERGKLRPTPEADHLHGESVPVFSQVAHVAQVVEQLKGAPEGVLRVAVAPYLGYDILPKAALRFADSYPRARLHLAIKSLGDQRNALKQGRIDLGIAMVPQAVPGISHQTLGKGAFVCLVPEGHPLESAAVIAAEDLERERRITGEAGSPLVRALSRNSGLDIEQDKPISVSSSYLVARLASLDRSVMLADMFTAAHCRGRGSIRPYERQIEFNIAVQHLSIRSLSHMQRVFLDYFTEAMSEFMRENNVYPTPG
ncbi:LysR family transcriptional regulator [Parahaliea mediterranea]|uniref:LysR family transcriptional regulator n=1 Tax=Parahaliea mediterranea TaxID=651086 RepID=A0A939DBD3_9GAMM|nr:LysR family transcriptional regulator [Parahaliea mediterranea]MBN7795036.1 LysR family transcriptional regulator [Parahaliea mediterranea]